MASTRRYVSAVASGLLLVGAVDLVAAVRQTLFRDVGLKDVLPNTDSVLFQTTARSLLDCARLCSRSGGDCRSFTHLRGSAGSWSCRGHSDIVTSAGDNATAMSGARSYRMLDSEVSEDACGNYIVIDNVRRDASGIRDCSLTLGWYRFLLNGSNAVISTTIDVSSALSFWLSLNGHSLPDVGQELTLYAINYLLMRLPVTVRHCGTFLIYKLQATPSCISPYHVVLSD